MSYVEQVLKAAGGHAAPEEVVDLEELENIDEAALEKDADDPCWDGYVQVGMKEKNGEMVPNCVPAKSAAALEKLSSLLSSDEIEEILSSYNSKVGAARQVALSAAAEVASRSYDAYFDSCEPSELSNAVKWELHSFLEYATSGTSAELDIVSEHDDLLNPGHPSLGLTASVSARIDWISAAPELKEEDREAVVFALSETSSDFEAIHASSRIKALAASGSISKSTLDYINTHLAN